MRFGNGFKKNLVLFVAVTSVCLACFGQSALADGSIIGWGEQVVGGDVSGGFVKVAAGGVHSLALKQDGSIVAFGQNFFGQCNVPSPNSGFIAISAGWYHSLALKQDGSIVAWGRNDYGQCNVPEPNSGFIAISAGGLHSLGLKQDGSIVAWGDNTYGQRNVPSPNSGFIAISAGGYHSLALKQDGSIVGWGYNEFRQCSTPLPNSGFIAISAGSFHSLGLKQDGSIVAWGSNGDGQCNIPSPNSGFIAISAGGGYSLGLKQDGSIVACGWNGYGQCNVPSPNSGFIIISTGYYHSVGLKQDGSIVAWGWDNYGQCNIPSPNSDFIAIAVGGYYSLGLKKDGSIVASGDNSSGQCNIPSPNNSFIAISAGSFHSLALKQDGSIVAWGSKYYGQCNIPLPNTGFVAIAAGIYHSLGLKNDGSIVAWGLNNCGQCNIPSPDSGFIAISAGGYYSLALKQDGSIVAWGDNGLGQCNIPSPNSGFIAISAGRAHSLALKQDGSIVGWGDNAYGKCNIPSPNSGFIAIAAGWEYSLALKQDGSIVGWGNNAYGKCNIPSPNSGFIAISAGEVHSLAIIKVSQNKLTGDLNDDYRVGWEDVRIFAEQWLDSDTSEQLPVSAAQNSNSPSVLPNDQYFPNQWHLLNTGQSGGTPGADIRAPEAWEITTGDPNIVVAVIDIGVDSKHPDLISSLVPGYDFWDLDDLPDPANDPYAAHGTMCAGLIAAEGNNGIGVTGVAYNCKIMPIRHGSTGGQITGEEEVTAFRWAAANGADVISCSWGVVNPITHSGVKDVTKLGGIGREGKGCVVLFAAGNSIGRIPPTSSPAYPEVIAVGATDHNDVRWDYSNYGLELDLMAPSGCDGTFTGCSPMVTLWSTDQPGEGGWSVINSDPNILDYTEYVGGTSASCPIAAGVAALLLSLEPNLTDDEVRHFLERSAKDLGAPGRDDYYGYGRVDARAALDMVLAKRADLNDDWKVDFSDFAVLAQCWKTDDLRGDIGPVPRPDGAVDVQDLALMGEYWLKEIPKMPELGKAWGPTPADGAINQPKSILYWNAGEIAIAHDVYFGNDRTAVENADTSSLLYIEQVVDIPGVQPSSTKTVTLQQLSTTYYWRIDEVGLDDVTRHKGDIWTFSTKGLKAYSPSPADSATNQPKSILRWNAGETATAHNVYFGTDATAVENAETSSAEFLGKTTLLSSTAAVALQKPSTTYYWRIDEIEADGVTIHKGDIWSFTTAGLKAHSPSPSDNALLVDPNAPLSWGPGFTARYHEVYLGTDRTAVENANTSSPLYKGRKTPPYTPGNLTNSTWYYWRVDEVESVQTIKYKGDVWQFKTIDSGGGM
jgi:alpha-tubulin suppressor-like RCC1 family protein